MIPGKEGLGVNAILWKLMSHFSGQTQTANIKGLIIIVSLMNIFNIYFINDFCYHNLVKRKKQDIASRTFKVVSNSGMLVEISQTKSHISNITRIHLAAA